MEFVIKEQPLIDENPNTDKVFKNVKELKAGDGSFKIMDDRIEFKTGDGIFRIMDDRIEFKTGNGIFRIIDGKIEFRNANGNILSEWLLNGVRNVYDSSGNIVIQENPNG